MARGRDPKPPDQRRNRNQLMRGEWVALPAVFEPTLPAKPPVLARNKKPHPRAARAWQQWRADPASSQWGPAEVFGAEELFYIVDELWRPPGDKKLLAEARQREDRLGLSAKGKRDLRWIAPTERGTVLGQEAKGERPARQFRNLRAIDGGKT